MMTEEEVGVIRNIIKPGFTVFDVGANTGEWTQYVVNNINDVSIHLFEPASATFDILEQNCSSGKSASLNLNRLALSDACREMTFNYHPEYPMFSGLYVRQGLIDRNLVPKIELVKCVTLDNYCRDAEIDNINFLKIDVEGAELDVLHGSAGMLRDGSIDYIQFEYGGTYHASGITLHEVYQYLTENRFIIFSMVSCKLQHLQSWHPRYEDYAFSNFLAVRADIVASVTGAETDASENIPDINIASRKTEEWKLITALIRGQRYGKAEEHLRRLLSEMPDNFRAYYTLGNVLEATQRYLEAVSCYEKASSIVSGHAGPHTRRSILLLKQYIHRNGGILPARKPGGRTNNAITMSTLGINGRFGNQILQYGFLRMYASEFDLQVEAPDWIGRYIFDLDDPYVSSILPGIEEDGDLFVRSLNRETPDLLSNHDIWGYCCYQTGGISRYRDLFRSLYSPGKHLKKELEDALATLREKGSTLVVMHLRRGDFGVGQYWIAPEDWYLEWIKGIWEELEDPVLYIATDAPGNILSTFDDYMPVTVSDIADPVPGVEFMHDFYMMTQADCLAISNSTFSFTASMINRNAKSYYRPARDQRKLVQYEPWDSDVLLK